MTSPTLDGIITRVHPGIVGIKFVKESLHVDKPVRKIMAHIIGHSYDDLAKMQQKNVMITAMFPDVANIRRAIDGTGNIDLGLCKIPDEIKMRSPETPDTVLITVVLEDSRVGLAVRMWTDKDIFSRT